MQDLTTVTEYFVIATGMSTTHVGALADEAEFQLDREGVKVLRTEGHDGKRWVLLDYGCVAIHVFNEEARAFYGLERLWSDGHALDLTGVLTPDAAKKKRKNRSDYGNTEGESHEVRFRSH